MNARFKMNLPTQQAINMSQPAKTAPESTPSQPSNTPQPMGVNPNVLPSTASSTPTAFQAGAIQNRVPFNAGAGIITLSATGTGANVKMQSPDNTVESIQGTLGTDKFTVDQLPDRAGLALGGATLLGIDVLREVLKVYAIYSPFIQFDGGTTAQLSNPIKFITASCFGTTNTDTVSPNTYLSNMQFVSTLVDLRRPSGYLMAANTAIQLLVANTVTVKMSWHDCAMMPYNQLF